MSDWTPTHTPIEQTDLFKQYEALSDEIWSLCVNWAMFPQGTVGKQLVKAIDSVGANLAEGDGRYNKADALHFFVIARGSAREAGYWLNRARARSLINELLFDEIARKLEQANKGLNGLINYRRNQTQMVREESTEYDASE